MQINEVKIKEWEKDASEGLAYAQFNLGFAYYRGIGVEKDDERAYDWFLKAAGQGQAGSQYHLGWLYDAGIVVEQNLSEVVNGICYLPNRNK